MAKYYCLVGTDNLIEEIIPKTQPEGAAFAGMDITELYSKEFIASLVPADQEVSLGMRRQAGGFIKV